MKMLHWILLAASLGVVDVHAAVDHRTQGDTTLFWVLLLFACVVYFAPSINAKIRRHPRPAGIVCLNILLGWTLIGWALALVWSYSGPPPTKHQAGNTENKYCAHCGGAIDHAEAFCTHCGVKVQAASKPIARSRLSG